jgi:hypothetical protein
LTRGLLARLNHVSPPVVSPRTQQRGTADRQCRKVWRDNVRGWFLRPRGAVSLDGTLMPMPHASPPGLDRCSAAACPEQFLNALERPRSPVALVVIRE